MSIPSQRAVALAGLHALVGTLNVDLDLQRTLDAVCAGVVEGLGFEVAVVNLLRPDGDYEVVAVEGSAHARAALLGQRGNGSQWDRWTALCTPVGRLLVDYRRIADDDDVPTWVPDTPATEDGDAWHPLDSVLAPLSSATSGPLGALSVDLPRDGRRPGPAQLELLEMYAAQASVAIDNARLHTELVARDSERAEAVGRLRALVDQAPVAIVELDREGLVRTWNPTAEEVFGWSEAEVLGRRNPATEPGEYDDRLGALQRGRVLHRSEVRRRRKDGTPVDVSLSSVAVFDGDGAVRGYVGVYADITERLRLERGLRHAAHHDALTGLPNRTVFRERLDALVQAAAPAALLLLDLDGFKDVNDGLGHAAGDLVLVELAARLTATARAGDLVARLGGDEFVVLLEQAADAPAVADRLVRVLAQPVEIGGQLAGQGLAGQATAGGHTVALGCSIGVAHVVPGTTTDAVMRQADVAMYAAKSEGRGTWRRFDPDLLRPEEDRRAAGRTLRDAFEADRLELRWQPAVDLRTGRVRLLEARAAAVGRSGLPPDLGTLADEVGLAVPLGAWLVSAACEALQRWTRSGPGTATGQVAVRLPLRQLLSPAVVGHVGDALDRSGLEPGRLLLLLPEQVLAEDRSGGGRRLEELAGLGVGLALDDFGTGPASLRRLRQAPLSTARLDAALLGDVTDDRDEQAVLEAMLTLLTRLRLRAVASGVETPEQLRLLAALGCPLAQGPLLGGWLSTDEVPAALAAPPRAVPRTAACVPGGPGPGGTSPR